MSAAVENLHRAEAEDMLTDAIPYFEFLGEPAARYLVATLGEEPDRKRRGRLLDVIRVLGPVAIPALQDGLHSPTWYLVRNTLNLMADMGDAGLLDEVVVCLRHADGRVRRSAVRALWKLGGPAGGKHLLACLPGSDPETQMEILFGLGQIQTPEAVPALVELAKNGGNAERLRIKTIETLGQISSPAAIPGLLELVRRKGRIFTSAEGTDIRIAAARALLAIGTPQAELGLRQVVADEPRNQDRDALQRILDLDAR
jgi:HEAT repeat protein